MVSLFSLLPFFRSSTTLAPGTSDFPVIYINPLTVGIIPLFYRKTSPRMRPFPEERVARSTGDGHFSKRQGLPLAKRPAALSRLRDGQVRASFKTHGTFVARRNRPGIKTSALIFLERPRSAPEAC